MNTIHDVGIKAVSSVVPKKRILNSELSEIYGEKETSKLISSIGVQERRVADDSTTTSDLCFSAAEKLFKECNIDKKDIDALIFVSQTPDYQLPATSCILQKRLGLSIETMSFDINMGCSGYVYGLKVAASLVNTGLKNVLLLVGDSISKIVKPGDRSTEFLFGDAGTASVIGKVSNSSLTIELGTDGNGFESIISRKPINTNYKVERGNNYSYLEMNGGEVFTFTLKRVPKLINSFLKNMNLSSSDIDFCVYHQANHFMLKHLLKKSKFSDEQVPISIDKYGNTSCASIPVTLSSVNAQKRDACLLVGFGVGLSWGCALCDLSNTQILPVMEYERD